MAPPRLVWHGALGLLLLPALLSAQERRPLGAGTSSGSGLVVQGTISEAGGNLPLAAARIRLSPPAPREGEDPPSDPLPPREILTDPQGAFRLSDVRPGRYLLEVSALGYRSVSQEVVIQGASPFEMRVGLSPEALALEGVVATVVRSPRLAAGGFYDRRQLGLGDFMERGDIERRAALRVSDLLAGFAGVQIRSAPRGNLGLVSFRGGCRPDLVLDGLNLGPNLSPDEVLQVGDLEAIELYRGPGAPIQYTRSSCGALLFWTADPATRTDGRPFSFRRLLFGAGFVAFAILMTR
jgi:hypothetical protein